MSIADSDSVVLPGRTPAESVPGNSPAGGPAQGLAIWLDGEVLACSCPNCQAPMSVRLWLMTADCWRCGRSIELTEEQGRQARELLEQRGTRHTPMAPATRPAPAAPRQPAAPLPPPMLPPLPQPLPQRAAPVQARPAPPLALPATAPMPRPAQVSPAPRLAFAPAGAPASEAGDGLSWAWLRNMPAWLISLVLHLACFLLMGLYVFRHEELARAIMLSSNLSDLRDEGEADLDLETPEIAGVEQVSPEPVIAASPDPFRAADVFEPANQPATGDLEGDLADLAMSPAVLDGPVDMGDMLRGRGGMNKQALLKNQGGTQASEAAVALGLKWLAAHQNYDGHWSLNEFGREGDCGGRCSAPGSRINDVAATSLALLPFLGAGQTPKHGEYKETVGRGLRWLLEQEGENGDLRGMVGTTMYAQGQAAIVLCEAYALTDERRLKAPAQKAIDFIVSAQHSAGGWRYAPDEAGDTSVVGWQIMALRSAQMAYLKVPKETFDRAALFLDSVQTDPKVALYSYMPGTGDTAPMSAEGMLCRQYSGWPRDNRALQQGVHTLLKNSPPDRNVPNMYYWYYATQVMHHMGGPEWKTWNEKMRDLLVGTQETQGHEAGSWSPRAMHDTMGGRLYMTALAVCTLEVYYRHLPLYRDGAPKGLLKGKAR